jgi:IclR family pca regulon transcriptional regulator
LTILEAFTEDHQELSLTDFAKLAGTNRSTIYRYINTLAHLGYISQDTSTKRYRLSSRVLRLGYASLASTPFIAVARPHLSQLAEDIGHTVSLAVLDETDIIYVDRFTKGIDINVSVGSRLPAFCTSIGKVLLAHVPEPNRSRLLDKIDFTPRGPNSIRDRQALELALARVRQDGYSINDEELFYGVRSIAAPIVGSVGLPVAGANVAVHGSSASFAGLVDSIAGQLLITAERISSLLVGRPASTWFDNGPDGGL